MKAIAVIGCAALTLALSCTAQADLFQPSHSCSEPYKPFEFTSKWEIQRFRDDVESYKQCIEDFVEEQNDAVRKHAQAAQEAIDEWNDFVNFELN